MDLNCEDWRSRDLMWDQTRYALQFFHGHLPFWRMEPRNELASAGNNVRVLAVPGEIYAVYLSAGGTANLNLAAGDYSVQWYDPRAGGDLQSGSVTTVAGPGVKPLGGAPSDPERDWAVLVRKR
jgi:hypothetical protein